MREFAFLKILQIKKYRIFGRFFTFLTHQSTAFLQRANEIFSDFLLLFGN